MEHCVLSTPNSEHCEQQTVITAGQSVLLLHQFERSHLNVQSGKQPQASSCDRACHAVHASTDCNLQVCPEASSSPPHCAAVQWLPRRLAGVQDHCTTQPLSQRQEFKFPREGLEHVQTHREHSRGAVEHSMDMMPHMFINLERLH